MFTGEQITIFMVLLAKMKKSMMKKTINLVTTTANALKNVEKIVTMLQRKDAMNITTNWSIRSILSMPLAIILEATKWLKALKVEGLPPQKEIIIFVAANSASHSITVEDVLAKKILVHGCRELALRSLLSTIVRKVKLMRLSCQT